MSSGNGFLTLGPLEIDLGRTIKLLQLDLGDDWFFDPLAFQDQINKEQIASYFEKNISDNGGSYQPLSRIEINIPKKESTLRYALETCFYDRIAFHFFGEVLIRHFDALVSRRVLSSRLDEYSFEKPKPRLFLYPIEQWKKFQQFVRIGSADKTVLQTDLQNYFENIRVADLRSTLTECLARIGVNGKEEERIRFCIDSLCRCMEAWSYNGSNGLPQNRDISHFLANIYMLPVDSYMVEEGYDYYRYVDDIRVICDDKYAARAALKKLIKELRKIGLNVNGLKTRIIGPTEEDHPSVIPELFLKLERIESSLNSRRKPLVALAFSEVRKQLIDTIRKKKVSDREFRFLIARICRIARCKDIETPAGFFEDITKEILKCIADWPYAMDQFYNYLVSVKVGTEELEQLKLYLLDARKAIYGWQNYLIWKILIFYQVVSDDLREYAKQSIDSGDSDGHRAGALLYLGACGDDGCRDEVIRGFSGFDNFFLQRHALIALQEVEFKRIKDSVAPHVRPESMGIYRTLRGYSTPKYIEPPKEVPIGELIRDLTFYE